MCRKKGGFYAAVIRISQAREERTHCSSQDEEMTLRVRMLLDSMLPDKDITPSQGNILGYLYRHCGEGETVTATQIHNDLMLSRATISALLKKLRLRGYLNFETAECDDRLKSITLTEKALKNQEQIDECFDYVEEQLFLGFSEDEKKKSIELLTRMLANLDQALKETMYSGQKRHSSVEKILSKEEEIS